MSDVYVPNPNALAAERDAKLTARTAARRLLVLFAIAAGSTLLISMWVHLGLQSGLAHHTEKIIDLWPDRAFYDRWFFSVPALFGSAVPILILLWAIVRIVQRRWSANWLMMIPFLVFNWWIMICLLASAFGSVEY